MLNIFNDTIYVVNSEGGTPSITEEYSLISEYNYDENFVNLDDYQLRQWVDM